MKRLLLAFGLLIAAATASAQHHHHHGHWRHGGVSSWHWMAPTLIGGVIGYEIARNQTPVILQQPPVIVQQPPLVMQSNCSPWTEVQNADGTITRTRTCTQ